MFWMVCSKCNAVANNQRDPQKFPFHWMLQDRLERTCWGSNLPPRVVGRMQDV